MEQVGQIGPGISTVLGRCMYADLDICFLHHFVAIRNVFLFQIDTSKIKSFEDFPLSRKTLKGNY